ncbi:ABC transporter substrate-binding protein [Amycolatopsis silviterrae]|uniref:ABC transporter substrate-binding protein n=1 Tax=Amycolatopsis silviterrae TaxID=1656914 RepID=A0ABW5H3I8_9PSEU
MAIRRALVAVLLLFATVACGGTPKEAAPAGETAGFPATAGSVTLARAPQRIVVLGPSLTEMLFAIGAGKQVVAVDGSSTFPSQAPRTGFSAYQPNAEAIAAERPDLVVLSNDLNNVVAQLGQLKIPVYHAPPAAAIGDSYTQLTDLGKLTGHSPGAAETVRRMKDGLAKVLADVPQRRLTYYYELDQTRYSATSRTFVGSLLKELGLDNIADPADADGSRGGYPQLSEEFVIHANPDLVLLADTKCCGQNAETVRARPGWNTVTAVRRNQIVALDDDIASRWGPRVVELVRAVADGAAKARG